MRSFKYYSAIFIGKLAFLILKLFGLGATAAPGLYASKIDHNLANKLAKQLKYSIIISGTNGKTTTARILATILKKTNLKYFHNRTGSNLIRGVVSELIKHIDLEGLPQNRIGLWEIDEAVLPSAIENLRPKIVILLNLFRDQLDRYGEIDTLVKLWQKALKKLPQSSLVILNADDPAIAQLAKNIQCQVIYFGIKDKSLGNKTLAYASDSIVCPHCSAPLNYNTSFVSHLGIYKCPQCGSIQPKTDVSCIQATFINGNHTQLTISYLFHQFSLKINLLGAYNIYNVLAAFSGAIAIKIKPQKAAYSCQYFQPAFGRLEKVDLKGKTLRLLLVKNPTSFNQALRTIALLTKNQSFSCLMSLNDLIADGRDVSWIWDIDFEYLNKLKIDKIVVSGTRAEDMALRIKYSNFQIPTPRGEQAIFKFQIEKSAKKAISTLINQSNKNLFILATYTAMLKTRKILTKMKIVQSTWKD